MADTDVIKGAIKVQNLVEDLCVETAAQLIQLLPEFLSIEVPATISNVVIGVQQPGDDRRDNLWIRLDNASSFVGIYVYSVGQWRQIYPVGDQNTVQLFRVVGDSRKIPAGFTLASDSPSLDAEEKNFIKGQWLRDSTDTFYKIFDLVYSGF